MLTELHPSVAGVKRTHLKAFHFHFDLLIFNNNRLLNNPN